MILHGHHLTRGDLIDLHYETETSPLPEAVRLPDATWRVLDDAEARYFRAEVCHLVACSCWGLSAAVQRARLVAVVAWQHKDQGDVGEAIVKEYETALLQGMEPRRTP